MTDTQTETIDFKLDRQNLFREESFTDLSGRSIRRLTPVKPDGMVDKSRQTIFVGHTSLMTPNGPVPLQAPIQAKGLQQAIKRFPEAMQEALARLLAQAQKMKAQEQEKKESRIILPGA
jgi:hypothetical protein